MSRRITGIAPFNIMTSLRTGSPEDRLSIPWVERSLYYSHLVGLFWSPESPRQWVPILFVRVYSVRGVKSGVKPPLSHVPS